ncbi:MAG: hypothetical protein JRC99_03200 [Deltaproteobacteria bacterium]|nr:hypothetical protein [Deltaproteobacteria bacterium]
MFQGEKGAIEFLADGRAIIYAVKGSADLSTLIHETGHFFRRQLTPDMNRLALKDMGFEEWTTPAEEKFARLWERWNRDGVAPTEVLREMFTMFREWLVGVYSQIKGSPIEAEVSPAMKTVFESLLVKQEAADLRADKMAAGRKALQVQEILEKERRKTIKKIETLEGVLEATENPELRRISEHGLKIQRKRLAEIETVVTEDDIDIGDDILRDILDENLLFQKDEEIGTGDAKVRGTSVSVVAKAIRDGIINENANISGLPEQNQMNMIEQADKALKLIQSDIDKAVRIAFYQEPAPEGLYPENVFTALRIWAKMAGDAELIMKLATDEGGARAHTILGKRIKSLDTGEDFADPVAAIKEIIAARKEKDIRDRTDVTQLEMKVANLEAELSKREASIGTQTKRTVRKARSNYGKANKVVSRSEYDDILARRQQPKRLFQADAAYTPTAQDFDDMAKIGMFHLEALGQDYEKWAYQLKKDLGDWVEPHLKKEYDTLLSKATENGISIPESKRLTAKKKRLTTMGKKIEAQLDRLDLEVAPRIPIALDPVGQRLQEEYNQIKAKLNAARGAANLITTEEVEAITIMSREVAIRKEKMETGTRRKDPGLAPTQVETDFGAASWAFRQYVGDLKQEANKRTFIQHFKGRNWHIDLIIDIGNTSKSLVLSLDNSFHGNQGLVSFYRGITGDLKSARIWATTFAKSFKMIWDTFKGKDPISGIYGQIISDPYYNLIKRTKISLFTTEEDIPTDLPTKLPLVGKLFKAGANAFEGSTYYQRYQLAVKYIQIYEKSGRKLDKATLEEIGQIVDTMTLRGKISKVVGKGKGTGFLNAIFISPRNLRATFDLMTSHLFSRNISMKGRMLAAGTFVRFAIGSHMLLALAWLIDDEAVTWDATNADYGKIKVGNTRFSVMGPFGSAIVLVARGYTKTRTSSTTGKTRKLNQSAYSESTSDLVWDFTKNKFSPLVSTVKHWVDERNRDGTEWDAMTALRGMTTPLMVQAYIETAAAEDAADMWLILIAECLGIRVMTYSRRTGPKKRKKRENF